MRFLPLTPHIAEDWDQVVCHADDGWAFHLAGWLERMTSIWNRQGHSFAVEDGDRLVAVMPLDLVPDTATLASGGWTHGGPIVRADLAADRKSELRAAIYTEAERIGRKVGARCFQVSLYPFTRAALDHKELRSPLLEFGFDDKSVEAWVVDLRPDEKTLWSNMSENAVRMVKKARAQGYTVSRRPLAEMLDSLVAIYGVTCDRNAMQNPPRRFYETFGDVLESKGYCHLWTCCAADQRPVAHHVSTEFGNTGYYHLGGSEDQHLKSGVNYLLAWEALLGAKASGCTWYGLGEAADVPGGKAFALSEFKRKLGAQRVPWFKGEKLFPVRTPYRGPRRALTWYRAARTYLASLFHG